MAPLYFTFGVNIVDNLIENDWPHLGKYNTRIGYLMSDIWWKEKYILTQKINVTEQIRREGEGDRRKYISYCLLKIILCETSYSVSIVILLKWLNISL